MVKKIRKKIRIFKNFVRFSKWLLKNRHWNSIPQWLSTHFLWWIFYRYFFPNFFLIIFSIRYIIFFFHLDSEELKDQNTIVRVNSPQHSFHVQLSEENDRRNGSQNSQQSHQFFRKREVALARISLCIVLVFLLCHIIRIIPNAYEMIQSYKLGVSISQYVLN